jgi:hypothetical protein
MKLDHCHEKLTPFGGFAAKGIAACMVERAFGRKFHSPPGLDGPCNCDH